MKNKPNVRQVVLDFPAPDATPSDKLRWYVEWLKKEAAPGQIVTDSVPHIIDEHGALLVIMECLLTHTHPKYLEKETYADHKHYSDGSIGYPVTD